jgi:hypothetical protein
MGLNFRKGQRISMADPDFLGTSVPVGTLGTVKAPTNNVGNVLVKWDDFIDAHGNAISGEEADDWFMAAEELAPVDTPEATP